MDASKQEDVSARPPIGPGAGLATADLVPSLRLISDTVFQGFPSYSTQMRSTARH